MSKQTKTAPAATPAERKAAERARKKEQGLIAYTVWVPNTDEAKAKTSRYAERLVKAHKKGGADGN